MNEVPGPSPAPKPPVTTTTSIWPAAAILGLAVVMLGVFLLVDFVTSKGVVPPPTTIPTVVGGLTRDTDPGPALKYCLQSEEVPSNIDSAFVVPVSTVPRSGANTPDLGAGEYDCYEPMSTANATSGAILSFFNAQLEARGWSLFSKGASNGEPQSLFQKAGSDGFYWEIGVTVTKSSSSKVDWTFEIYQNSDTV
ncbi:MAG TPA: hypothetical protein VG246_09765 [Acidimicrobiales bacterium]|nr:hypothetical protein [Acidimicrobiales bacterium]